MFVPKENRPDVEELSTEITKGLEIFFVSHIDEVLGKVLIKKEETEKKS